MKNKVEYDGEEDGVTKEAQSKKCETQKPNTDTTNYSICSNRFTSVSRNNNNNKHNEYGNKDGEKEVTNMESNTVTINDGRNEEALEAKVNSEDSNSINGRSTNNSKSYYVVTKILKRPDKNKNEMKENNVGYDGENPSETREPQQEMWKSDANS